MERISVLLSGYNGRMGRALAKMAEASGRFTIAAGVDINPAAINPSFPVYMKLSDFSGRADVIVDFSIHSAADALFAYAVEAGLPAVIATTGHTPGELELIKRASASVPIFKSANMSLGVNLLAGLAKKATALLKGYDVEIVEAHHNQKLDAPSGTALMLAEAVGSAMEEAPEYVYDRHNVRRIRGKNEIGLHSIRGGTIVGEHEVIFAGADEVLKLSHSALSREMFASGALRAAEFIIGKAPGLYSMEELISSFMD